MKSTLYNKQEITERIRLQITLQLEDNFLKLEVTLHLVTLLLLRLGQTITLGHGTHAHSTRHPPVDGTHTAPTHTAYHLYIYIYI